MVGEVEITATSKVLKRSDSPVQVNDMFEQSSQIKEKWTKKIKPRKNRIIPNGSSEAWYCFMCDDIVKEDLIKCQECLRGAQCSCRWGQRATKVVGNLRKVVIN